jgi:hypothetical protein
MWIWFPWKKKTLCFLNALASQNKYIWRQVFCWHCDLKESWFINLISLFITFSRHSLQLKINLQTGWRMFLFPDLSVCALRPYFITFMGPCCSADKSLARPTFRCILFDGENISFMLVLLYIYIYIYIYKYY